MPFGAGVRFNFSENPLEQMGDRWVPYRLLGANGAVIEPAEEFFAELQRAPIRSGQSYAHHLLQRGARAELSVPAPTRT